jgi:hypothetical protein
VAAYEDALTRADQNQRQTIMRRGRGRYLQARKAIPDVAVRVSDIDGEIQRLDAERARLARRYRTIEQQINDNLVQLGALRSRHDQEIRRLAKHQAVLADATQRRDTLTEDHRRATQDRKAAGQARDNATDDLNSLQDQVEAAEKAFNVAVAAHESANTGHSSTSADVNRVAGHAVTALTDAVGVADAGLVAIQTGIANFGNGLPKVPTVVQSALSSLGSQRAQLATALANIAPLNIVSAPGHVQPLERVFREIDDVVTRFNAEVDRIQQELDNEFAATRDAITRAARNRCIDAGEYANAVFVDDQLAPQQLLRNTVTNFLAGTARKNACLQNPTGELATLLTEVDELLRRYRISLLRAKYNQVCFSAQVPQVLRGCLAAAGTTPAAAEIQVRNLRLNPTIGELRRALRMPAGRDWEMWPTTSQYDGVEIHVTISADSIRLPGAAINTFADGAALFNAVFILPAQDDWKEVHATLNWGDHHPAVFVSAQPKFWTEYRQRRRHEKGETFAVAQQHVVAAQNAVQALLNQWQAQMETQCLLLINRVNLAPPQDICGQALPQ